MPYQPRLSIIAVVKIFSTFEWKVFFKELYDKFFETDVMSAAAQVAFYFSFAFFPLLLFLGLPEAQSQFFGQNPPDRFGTRPQFSMPQCPRM